MEDNERYMSEKDTLSRLVRLETKICLKFEEIEKATVLAREQIEKDKVLARQQLDHRLEGMNEFQRRMDKLAGTFVTKSDLEGAIKATKSDLEGAIKAINIKASATEKLVMIGVGIVVTLQFVFHFLLKA
jgi:hypothetical protein